MLNICWYYDERCQDFKRTCLKELKQLEQTDKGEFLYIKDRLYRSKNKKIPMTLVRNGLHQGFRRKAEDTGNFTTNSRGAEESLTHQGNKEAISTLKKLTIEFDGEKVTLYNKNVEIEKQIVCNGRTYEIDLYFELEKTEPEKYFKEWNGKLWFEIFHTCPVDSVQSEDFRVQNETLFEYKITEDYNFVDNISIEGYEKRQNCIINKYKRNVIKGYLISKKREETLSFWKLSKNGNWTANIGDNHFTVIKSRNGEYYGLVYGDGKLLWEYNGKKNWSIDDAKKIADLIAFELYNSKKIRSF